MHARDGQAITNFCSLKVDKVAVPNLTIWTRIGEPIALYRITAARVSRSILNALFNGEIVTRT